MKFKKTILLLFTSLFCVGCSNTIKTSENWEMSSEAKAYYDYYQTANDDACFKQGEIFNNWLASLLIREKVPQTITDGLEFTHTPTVSQVNNQNVYTFDDGEYDAIVLYIHGGSYVCEAVSQHYKYCDGLVDALNAKVVLPLYPLAPQYTYVDAYDMIVNVYNNIVSENKPIYLIGDSAGGGFALAFTEYAIANNLRVPDKLVMFSPWIDINMDNPDMLKYEDADKTLSTFGLSFIAKLWAGDTDMNDYRLSPINGNLNFLPDTLLFVATDEILYPEILSLYKNIKNTNVKLIIGNGYFHDFPIYDIPEKQLSYNLIKEL